MAGSPAYATIDWHGTPARLEYRWLGTGHLGADDPRADANEAAGGCSRSVATADRAARVDLPEAPVVVFLHEGLGSVSAWRDFPERFCAAHGLVGLVFSRRGYGLSTPRPATER